MIESTDETFNRFLQHWQERNPAFQLDNEDVRIKIVMLLSAAMSVLATCDPAVVRRFMDGCGLVAQQVVPMPIQREIKQKVG